MGQKNKTNFAILGLLSFEPMSGYEIKKKVEETIGHFWQESYGHIYPTLKKLHDRKLVTRRIIRRRGKPDRHEYSLTPRGRDELEAWLTEPLERAKIRNELLLRISFWANSNPAALVELLEQYLADQQQILARYQAIQPEIDRQLAQYDAEDTHFYWRYTIRFGLHAVRSRIRWCEETLKDVRSRLETESSRKRRDPKKSNGG